MRPDVIFVHDDGIAVPDAVASLTGIPRFGEALHRRQRLAQWVDGLAEEAGFRRRVRLQQVQDRRDLARSLAEQRAVARVVYVTADVVGTDPEAFQRFLAKLGWSERDVLARPAGAGMGSVCASLSAEQVRLLLQARSPEERAAWFADRQRDVEAIPELDSMVSLSDVEQFVRFLAGSFSTRAFNRIDGGQRTIVKRSADVDKMRREARWWQLLPAHLQRHAVQPYDLREEGDGASYRMERLNVPDMAVLWLHGPAALPHDTFLRFLDAVFDWFEERGVRDDPSALEQATELYVHKVDRRIADFLALPVGARTHALLEAGGLDGGLTGLVARYHAARTARWASHPPASQVAITHGDLCFSNILFDKRSALTRFIDPRGADHEDELWMHPTYDLAKLSHSILGGYDFINAGLFDVVVGDRGQLELRADGPRGDSRQVAFLERVQALGISVVDLRLHEASLFLSMLPLHAEDPRKVLGFALNARDILDRLGEASPSSPGLLQRLFE